MTDYEDEDEVKIEMSWKTSILPKSMDSQPPAWYNSCYVTKKPLTIHNDIKSSTQRVRSKTRCATSSSTTELVRTSFLVR